MASCSENRTLLVLMRLMFDYVNLHSRRQSTDLFQLYIVLNEITIFNLVKKKMSFCFCFWDLEASGLCAYNSDPHLLPGTHCIH